jgi:hypothetical protein
LRVINYVNFCKINPTIGLTVSKFFIQNVMTTKFPNNLAGIKE